MELGLEFVAFAFLFIYFLVPDLETVEYKVLSRRDQYEIREVEV